MARRLRKISWNQPLLRALRTFTRAGVRAAAQTALAATPKPKRRKPVVATAAEEGHWAKGIAIGPTGSRRYRLYRPAGATRAERLPLMVMLHGCGQDGERFASSTRLHRLAAQQRFCVLYPEQDRLANAGNCWNWYETRSGRAYGEAALIVAAIDQVCTLYGTDATRVAVAGLSAGGSMAALLATRYPARFSAVALHSGIAPGAADSTGTALSAMRGRRTPLPLSDADNAPPLPPLLVIQGTSDTVVRPNNGRTAVQLWADATGALPAAPRTVQRGARYPATVTDFKLGSRVVATLYEIEGLGHAWSGGAAGVAHSDPKGPNASRMIWSFAARQFR